MIGEEWSVDEILDAQALDSLEGSGQTKRMVARLCAEIHNAISLASWRIHGKEGSSAPDRVDESLFLPVRRTLQPASKVAESQAASVERNIQNQMLSLCGY